MGEIGLNVGMVYDLRREYLAMGYGEDEVTEFDSDETINLLADAIGALGHEVERVGHGRMDELAQHDRPPHEQQVKPAPAQHDQGGDLANSAWQGAGCFSDRIAADPSFYPDLLEVGGLLQT